MSLTLRTRVRRKVNSALLNFLQFTMFKAGHIELSDPHSQRKRGSWNRRRVISWFVFTSCSLWLLLSCCEYKHYRRVDQPHFPGSKPEHQLSQIGRGEVEWHKCDKFGAEFECGTLVAPLDYTNETDPRNATIALIRFRAGGGSTPRDSVLGSVIFNPGGPGGSGLAFLTKVSSSNSTLSTHFDEILDSKYDLVSFDPRGVGSTSPLIDCFEDPYASLVFSVISAVDGKPGEHTDRLLDFEFGTVLAESQLMAEVCASSKTSELLKYVSTASTARDMQLLHRALGDEKLNYWGFSYGSVLGSTYADMFPDDVNRLVIDAVVDVPNYFSGEWTHAFKDIEKEYDWFFRECWESGVSHCKLASLGATYEEVKKVVDDYANSLKTQPIPVATADPPQMLTYSTLNTRLFEIMYSPQSWPRVADLLYAAIVDGNAAGLLTPLNIHPTEVSGLDGATAIMCGDILAPPAGPNGTTTWDIRQFRQHFNKLREDSPHFGSQFAAFAPLCHGSWTVRSVDLHRGNFTSNTSFPILSLGNEYDPVTPRRYAEKMAELFPSAVHVLREGYGHGSFSQDSKCLYAIIRDYFVDGNVPETGVKCPVDAPIFGNTGPESPRASIAEALRDINRF